MRNIVTRFLAFLFFICAIPIARASDIPINPLSPIFTLANLQWGVSAGNGFNNNFFFTPSSQQESVCIYIYNNNPTSTHTFTATIAVTANTQSITPSDNTWPIAASNAGLSISASPSVPTGLGVNVSGVSQVAVELSASSVQAGSPDTATVRIVQTQGSCVSSQSFTYSVPQSIAALTPYQANSESLGQAYAANGTQTNPVANQVIAGVNSTASAAKVTGYLDSVTVSSSAAGTLTLTWTSNTGTCTETTPLSVNASAGASGGKASQAFTFRVTCAASPTVSTKIVDLNVGAGIPFTYDLKGVNIAPNNGNGIEVISTAITGTVSASFKWYEK